MRLNNVLKILQAHLASYDTVDSVRVGNAGSPSNNDNESVLISLIKVEEENILKNGKFQKTSQNFKVVYKNRPVHTNLYVLFAANYKEYDTSLTRLSQVVEFFQGKNVFTHTDGHAGGTEEKFKIIVELVNLSFEQINYIWSFLGGKPLPSVFYKIRLIELEAREKQTGEGEPIYEINIDNNAAL